VVSTIIFFYKLRAFLDYSYHKQFFLFKAFASSTSAPPLEKSWLYPWGHTIKQSSRASPDLCAPLRPALFDFKKCRPTFTEKQIFGLFLEVTPKRSSYFCGRKVVRKSRTKAYRAGLGKFGKNLHTRKNLPAPD